MGTQNEKPSKFEDVSAKDDELKFRVDPELRRQAEENVGPSLQGLLAEGRGDWGGSCKLTPSGIEMT